MAGVCPPHLAGTVDLNDIERTRKARTLVVRASFSAVRRWFKVVHADSQMATPELDLVDCDRTWIYRVGIFHLVPARSLPGLTHGTL
jgi:hypothetical protein